MRNLIFSQRLASILDLFIIAKMLYLTSDIASDVGHTSIVSFVMLVILLGLLSHIRLMLRDKIAYLRTAMLLVSMGHEFTPEEYRIYPVEEAKKELAKSQKLK